MENQEEINLRKEEYKCIRYKERKTCDTCDGFGRNLDKKVNADDCYISRKLKDSLNEDKVEINNECNKHPNHLDGNSPKELAEKFGNTSYFYQREFFMELGKNIYPSQSKDDREKRNRIQLSIGLELIAQEITSRLIDSIDYVCKICEKHMSNPYKK